MAPSLSIKSNTAALTGFAVGSAVTLLGVWLTCSRSPSTRSKDNAAAKASASSRNISAVTLPPEIREEQLSRHTLYFGEDGMENLKNSSILVVGVGGVGSHIAHMVRRPVCLSGWLLFWLFSYHLFEFFCNVFFFCIARTRWNRTSPLD